MTDTNRHGTNAHPELPPCPSCGRWAWQNNSTEIGRGVRCWYSCGTDGCNGRGLAVFQGLAVAVLWPCPLDGNGYYQMPDEAHAWLSESLRVLRVANIGGCVHEGKAPGRVILPTPPKAGAACLAGWKTWHDVQADAPATMDLTDLFVARVTELRRVAA
jgi:hypothetical protein